MKYVGWALVIAGAAGAYYRYTLYQASAQGNPALANQSVKMFDIPTYLNLSSGTGLFDVPMLVNAGAVVLGLALVGGKKIL